MIPLLLISGLTYNNYRNYLEKATLSRLQDAVSLRASRIEQYFERLKTYVIIVRNTYTIKKNLPVLAQGPRNPPSPEFSIAKEILDQTWRKNEEYLNALNIMLVNRQAEAVYSTNPGYPLNQPLNYFSGPVQKALSEEKDEVYVSEIFLDKALDNKPTILLSAPAIDLENNHIGAIAIEADLAPVYHLTKDMSGLGNTGETLVGKKVGKQLVFLNPLRDQPDAALKKIMDIGGYLAGPMQKAVQGATGAGEMIDYRGVKVVAAWRYIPSLGWGIVAKIDAQEAYAEIVNLRNLILSISGIIFVLSAIMAFYISRSISGPLKTLAKGAEIVGSGDLDYKIALNSKDELGQLAATFDKMTRDLKTVSASRDAERQRLYGVLEALPVYVVLLSEDYRVPFANKFFRERFGDSGGKRCYEYLFKRSSPCENCQSYKVLETNAPHHWEWNGPDSRNYSIYDFPFTDSDGSRMIMEMGIDVTEQKQAQERLRLTSQYARSLIESSLDPLVTISSDGKITDVNEATIRTTGSTREELIGTNFSSYFTEPEKAQAGYRRVFDKGFVTDYPLTIRHKDGKLTDVLYNATVYKDNSGNVLGVFAAARDVTLLKQAEAEVDKHRHHLEELVSERTIQLQAEIAVRKRAEEALTKSQEGLEMKVVERTSQLLQLNDQLNQEIVERRNIENEVRERNSLLRLAAKAGSRKDYLDSVVKLLRGWSGVSCVGIRLLNEEGKIPYESFVGFSQEFWEKENWLSVKSDKCACIRVVSGEFDPADAHLITPCGSFYCRDTEKFISGISKAQMSQFRGECIREGFKSLAVIPIRLKDKIIGALHLADKSPDLPDPKVFSRLETLAMRIAEDIIKFNLADKITKSTEFLERVFSSTNFHIAYMDVNFNFIRVNQAYAQMEDKTPEFFVGKNHFAIFPNEENEGIFRKVVETGQVYTTFDKPFEYKDRPERGVTYWDWSLQPLKDTSGKVEGLVLFLVDTTKRKQAEEELVKTRMQLIDAKRLSDVGTLAATVAHELRNPLAAIQIASYNIRRKAQGGLLDKHLLTIDNKVNESEQIISNLLFYSRLKAPRYELVNIHKIISECIELVKKRFAKEKSSLHAEIASIKKVSIEADPVQIKEVFFNVLNNAYECQAKGSKRVEMQAREDGGNIVFTIKDNGEGIDKNDLERIFDPFFTTKAKGTGLGLTVCRQIINFHGGSIGVESEKGNGAVVTISLPLKRGMP